MDSEGLTFLLSLTELGYVKGGGAIVEIGAQELFLEGQTSLLIDFMNAFGVPTVGSEAELEAMCQRGPARSMWELAGFSYSCVDTSGEFGSMEIDLNYDSVSWRHRGQYDVVTNFGCTEHIANQMNAFKVIHDFGKPDAIMVHGVPIQGFVAHGLVN